MVVSIDRNRIYTLNASASQVWQALGDSRSLDELATVVCAAYRIDKATARADCQQFCDELVEQGLVACLP
ncbi:MAG: PqqD family protein [Deltaproteobacteria bacterium]|nr:PqqD family protein [Deltaproteobacteria bacterium]